MRHPCLHQRKTSSPTRRSSDLIMCKLIDSEKDNLIYCLFVYLFLIHWIIFDFLPYNYELSLSDKSWHNSCFMIVTIFLLLVTIGEGMLTIRSSFQGILHAATLLLLSFSMLPAANADDTPSIKLGYAKCAHCTPLSLTPANATGVKLQAIPFNPGNDVLTAP